MNTGEEIAYDFIMTLLSIALIVLCIALIVLCRKKPIQSEETLDQHPPSPVLTSLRTYPLTDIDLATDRFDPRRIIGKGRLGTVYATTLPGFDKKELVAVKRIHSSLVLNNPGFGFASIIKTLSLASHPNIARVLGFSQGPGERIIVMELVNMPSLDFYLQENCDGASLLDWTRRLRIAIGIARGLEYLHEKMAPNIIHGSFKASNVLLDSKFCAKICDYGLYFMAPNDTRGLLGYVDEEYWLGYGACKENDVYGFGVVLLEILTGKRNEGGLLVKWALPLIKEMRVKEILDDSVVVPSGLEPIVRLAKVASACVSNSRRSRPTIVQVVTILNSLECEIYFD